MKPIIQFLLAALPMVVGGCGAPRSQMPGVDDSAAWEREAQLHLEARAQRQQELWSRLHVVSHSLLKAAVPFCDEQSHQMGFYFWNESYPVGDRDETRAWRKVAGGSHRQMIVLDVADNSPAMRAGIRKGDEIVKVNGRHVFGRPMPDVDQARPNTLVLRRAADDTLSTIRITGEAVCDYPVVVDPDHRINAWADGRVVGVTEGMLDMLVDDVDLLRIVIGHEIAHNTHKHIDTKRQNAVLGSLVDILAAAKGFNTHNLGRNTGALMFSKEFEHEADYVGTYIVARAGHDVGRAPELWRMMSARHGVVYSRTHPVSPARAHALRETIREIHSKQDAGLPLIPNEHPGH